MSIDITDNNINIFYQCIFRHYQCVHNEDGSSGVQHQDKKQQAQIVTKEVPSEH